MRYPSVAGDGEGDSPKPNVATATVAVATAAPNADDPSSDVAIARLAREWSDAWEVVVKDAEKEQKRLQTRLKSYDEAIAEEQKQLKKVYEEIDSQHDREWTRHKDQIERTIGRTLLELDDLVEAAAAETPGERKVSRSKAVANQLQQVHKRMHDVAAGQIPLYELSAPTANADALPKVLQEFDRLYDEWRRTAEEAAEAKAQQQQQSQRRRGLVSRVKSRVRRFFGVNRNAPPNANDQPGLSAADNNDVDLPGVALARRQFQRALETRLLEVAAKWARTLRLLMGDILKDVRQRLDRQKAARQQLAESKTGVGELKRAVADLRRTIELRDRAVHQSRVLSDEEKQRLEQAVTAAKDRLARQTKLIAQTQQQTTKASQAAARRLGKRTYPAVNSLDFAKELQRLYPELQMRPKSASEGSACKVPDPGAPPPPAQPYQALFRRLVTPDSPYRGFVAKHGVGAGKTRLGIETIDQWFGDQIAANGSPGAPVLVLVPDNKLLGTWATESRKFFPAGRWALRDFSKTDNTTILELNPNPAVFGPATKGQGYVILHKMTVLPDAASARVMAKTLPSDQELIEASGYHLPSYDYDTHAAYKDLTAAERLLLKRQLDDQKRHVAAQTKLMLPSKGLVIVDEAHNLVNPQEKARDIRMSRTALCWCNLLRQCTKAKLLMLTATPLLDDNKLTDLFKLLNFLQMDVSKRAFEGTWRTALPSDASDAEKEAAAHADELESRYLWAQLFEPSGDWKAGMKLMIQQYYAGIVSYLTLSNDPTVYPALSRDCTEDPNSSCSYSWNVAKQELEELSLDQLEAYGLPKPKSGKNVLVPMTARQFKEMQKAVQTDLGSWREHRRIDATPPDPPGADRLNYAGPPLHFKSSIMHSWGMKAYKEGVTEWPQKAFVVLHLMKQHPTDKFFIYTSSQAQRIASQLSEFLTEIGGYDVWDIPRVAKFVIAHPKERQGESDKAAAQLAKAWLAENSPKKRVMMFIGSATALAGLNADTQALIRDVMMSLYNQPANVNGEFFQAFIGDRSTKEGLSLLETLFVIFLEPSANATMQTQAEARVLRFCSLTRHPFDRWRQVQLYRLISVPPPLGAPGAGRGRRKRAAGGAKATLRRLPVWRLAAGLESRLGRLPVPRFAGARVGSWRSAENARAIGVLLRVVGGRRGGAADGVATGVRTNEEWHYLYMHAQKPASQLILQALKEIAIDCLLFRDYNGDPTVPLCYGQAPADLPPSAFGSSLPRSDRFCSTTDSLLLQDENDEKLTEFSLTGINPEGLRDSDMFERACKLAPAKITRLGPVTYRDLLVLEALRAPAAVNTHAIERKFGLQPDTLIIRAILDILASSAPVHSQDEDLKLWMLVSALTQEAHRAQLERLVQHRLARKTDDEKAKFTGMVEQITGWMRLKLELDIAIDNLIQFLQQLPTLENLPTPKPPTPPASIFGATRMLEPSAPPMAAQTAGPRAAAGARLWPAFVVRPALLLRRPLMRRF